MSSQIPDGKQLRFMDWEYGVFFHFGIRTFYEGHKDWDNKPMPIEAFNPALLDCDNWLGAVKAAGAKYAVLVTKHHDGFANWPSKFTEYAVHNTTWKDGKGDVVQEFVDACRKHGIAAGLYYSPAQWGENTIASSKEYNDYFISQLSELLCNYGKIDYIWFDGCGSEGFVFDIDRIMAEIRRIQPDILVFDMFDPDVRWVGNEAGVAYIDNSNIAGSCRTENIKIDGVRFLPADSSCKIRDENWFYSEYDAHKLLGLDELVGMYYHCVGNGANLLINVAPDRRGLLPEADSRRLIEFGDEIKRRFECPLPSAYEPDVDGGSLKLDQPTLVNHLVLREDLTRGEKVRAFYVYACGGNIYTPAMIHMGKFIGNKRIVTFPDIRASELIVKVEADDGFAIYKPEAYYIK